MEEELNIRKVYNNELRKWQGKPLTSTQESLDSYQEICCGCVLLSEENLREMHRYWEITELAASPPTSRASTRCSTSCMNR